MVVGADDPTQSDPQFGAPIRWLPALIEAELARNVSEEQSLAAFHRFRDEVEKRLQGSEYLQLLEPYNNGRHEWENSHPLRDSIVSFEVFARRWDGSVTPMGAQSCRRIFELLNEDVRDLFPAVSLAQQSMLSQEFHIGQPAELGSAEARRAILRLVIGVRFFNIVAYAGAGATAAALESEISDLIRAIDKLEFLAENWWRIDNAVT
ncbi:hypothetical protein [Kineobactrum salinum]|uniref:Uncharacterized protein n=1 Tax=Kineobactrum salinum TaxID=2708301 RepID=A0A6C0TZB4_9GAMM|nr:hypothetical protein [Kineobactrum salinum]QIB64709.1 hypothetical protein G3T16_04195 [Kineobactrum salinum]